MDTERRGDTVEMNSAALGVAASWWAQRLQVERKREEFRVELLAVLRREWADVAKECRAHGWTPIMRPGVDYDPDPLLLEALRAVGIECRGVMCSADGLFLRKTCSEIGDGYFAVSDGRGAPWVDVYGKREK